MARRMTPVLLALDLPPGSSTRPRSMSPIRFCGLRVVHLTIA